MTTAQDVTQLLAASGLPSTSPAERLRGVPAAGGRLHRALLRACLRTEPVLPAGNPCPRHRRYLLFGVP